MYFSELQCTSVDYKCTSVDYSVLPMDSNVHRGITVGNGR